MLIPRLSTGLSFQENKIVSLLVTDVICGSIEGRIYPLLTESATVFIVTSVFGEFAILWYFQLVASLALNSL